MEKTIEEIMTGKVNIDLVLQENREKIQAITTELEEIVRKGYFDILNNTENLVKLSRSDVEWPRLVLPEGIEVPEQPIIAVVQPIDDQIWDLINNSQFLLASSLIAENLCDSQVKRIRDHLMDPYFYSVFDLPEQALDRFKGFLLLDTDPSTQVQALLSFFCRQLMLKLLSTEEMDSAFLTSAQILDEICAADFYGPLSLVITPEIVETEIKSSLASHIPAIVSRLTSYISGTTDPSLLISYLKSTNSRYGMPCIWDLCSEAWQKRVGELIFSQSRLRVCENLAQTLESFENQTKSLLDLLKALPGHLSEFITNIERELPQAILGGVEQNPLVQLGFIRYFHELSLAAVLVDIDFSDFEADLAKKLEEIYRGKSILEVCQGVRLACGDRKLSLQMLDMEITHCRRGFGQIINRTPNQISETEALLPARKLPSASLLSLPPRFLPHLIHN